MTAGGPILKDKLWYFGAGRFTKPERGLTLAVTGGNYTTTNDERRYEGKTTYALNPTNNVKLGYTKRTTEVGNNRFGPIMDMASLYDNSTDQHVYTGNYTSVLSNTLFVEGKSSKKIWATMDTGSRFTDLVKGTPISDRSRLIGTASPVFNSPTFCAVCGGGWLEHRDNWDYFGKVSYFLSTSKTGSHNIVAGFDNFKEWRKNDNWQSGSQYNIAATKTIIDGATIYPVFQNDNTTFINYLPILQQSVGNDIRTYSTYANDAWRLSNHLSFNIGARFDLNRSKDQSGTSVVRDSQWSPRLGVTWDIQGNGKWTTNVGFARYVAGISTALVDAGSAGGRQASFSWNYQGPNVNTGAGPYLTADKALPILWDWFFANGGNNRTTRTTPNIPGLSTKVRGDVVSPSTNEVSLGVANIVGRAEWRLDYVHRKSVDMYGDFLTLSTGKEPDSTGRQFDLTLLSNSPQARRAHHRLTPNPGYITPIGSVAYYFTPRGDFRWDPVYSTDLAVTWGKRLPPLRNSEVFFRGVITNVFNNAARTRGDIGINTRFNNTAYQAFNPFTTTPVQGVHWNYSDTFGQPANFDDYQPARLFSFSVGLRF